MLGLGRILLRRGLLDFIGDDWLLFSVFNGECEGIFSSMLSSFFWVLSVVLNRNFYLCILFMFWDSFLGGMFKFDGDVRFLGEGWYLFDVVINFVLFMLMFKFECVM